MESAYPDIPIIYSDANVIVINKPAGVLTHPTPSKPDVYSVASAFADKIDDPDPMRAGIVHRLDRDTSGVMILARNLETKQFLQTQFKQREVNKVYLALIWGNPKLTMARIELPISHSGQTTTKMKVSSTGKMAISEYRVRQQYEKFSLVEVLLMTGRMHQIRVHFAHLGNPVVGDPIYSRQPLPDGLGRMFLHAAELSLEIAPGQKRSYEAPLPADLERFLHSL